MEIMYNNVWFQNKKCVKALKQGWAQTLFYFKSFVYVKRKKFNCQKLKDPTVYIER